MQKKPGNISSTFSQIDSLKFSTFNYFGMGAVLTSVADSFWINFSAYYLNNILPHYGNIIFLVAQLFEGVGILLGWLILAKLSGILAKNKISSIQNNNNCLMNCSSDINLYMVVYILGAFLLITCLPLVFLLSLSNPVSVFTFAILAKLGSGFMIISQITIIPKITLNKSRRVLSVLKQRKLVEKVAQYGLGGTFISMFSMTLVSTYVTFVWKYFFGVCAFAFVGAICSIIYVYKIRSLAISQCSQTSSQIQKRSKQILSSVPSNAVDAPPGSNSIAQWSLLKLPRFYVYAAILVLCTLYMDIVIAIYPYFIKSFRNISHLKYLSAITALYLSSFLCSLLTKNAFVFSGIRSIMSVGFVSCILATVLLVIGLIDHQFDSLMIIGTCLTGVSKVIATNCALNVINEFIGKNVKGRQFVYGFFYFFEKIISGIVLFALISKVYVSPENIEFLHFSEIYLPFILYSLAWVLVMIERTLTEKLGKQKHIVIIEQKGQKSSDDEQCDNMQYNLSNSKNGQFDRKYKNRVNKEHDNLS